MNPKEDVVVNIPTEDQLFEHACQFKDMKLSAYNPRSLSYYCQECGGKFIIEKDMHDWNDLFGEPMNLKLNKRVMMKVLKVREEYARMEEEELEKKDEEARRRAEEVRTQVELARKKKEEEVHKQLEEEARIRSEEIRKAAENELNEQGSGKSRKKSRK
jgi:hypothetical protein